LPTAWWRPCRKHLAPAEFAKEPVQHTLAAVSVAVTEAEEAVGDYETEETFSGGRLLIVEDNDDLRQYLVQLFSSDFEATVAADGVEGWALVQSLLLDLVLSDIMMPRSDGLELCQKIKQAPKMLHIPVVLLTARTAAVHEVEGLETGAGCASSTSGSSCWNPQKSSFQRLTSCFWKKP